LTTACCLPKSTFALSTPGVFCNAASTRGLQPSGHDIPETDSVKAGRDTLVVGIGFDVSGVDKLSCPHPRRTPSPKRGSTQIGDRRLIMQFLLI
jgi:hypothetical protein